MNEIITKLLNNPLDNFIFIRVENRYGAIANIFKLNDNGDLDVIRQETGVIKTVDKLDFDKVEILREEQKWYRNYYLTRLKST